MLQRDNDFRQKNPQFSNAISNRKKISTEVIWLVLQDPKTRMGEIAMACHPLHRRKLMNRPSYPSVVPMHRLKTKTGLWADTS
jgi:hypothetical protein